MDARWIHRSNGIGRLKAEMPGDIFPKTIRRLHKVRGDYMQETDLDFV
jgi:hypothetical protein